jgi:hypothetical protein
MTTSDLINQLEGIESRLTRRPWKMWGCSIRAAKPGFPDDECLYDNSELVASFPLRDDPRPGSRGTHVMDAYETAALRNLLPEIIDRLKDKASA